MKIQNQTLYIILYPQKPILSFSVSHKITRMSTTVSSNPVSYFCYACKNIVSISASPSSDLSCPICSSDVLEEAQTAISDNFTPPNPFPPAIFPDPILSLFGDSFGSGSVQRGPVLISSTVRTSSDQNPVGIGGAFDPFTFLQSYIGNLRSGEADFQFVVNNGDPISPANLGDYFMGPGLEQLIQQLAENDPNRYGTPPASKSAVETLPNVSITEDIVNSESNSCAVCMTEFEIGAEAKQMPCKHIFHPDCILPWLNLHNSCPVCRFELPADDQDYETRRAEGGASGSGSSTGGSNPGAVAGRSGERTFRIQVPWPFGSGRHGGSGGGNDNASDGGRGNPGSQ